MSEVHPDVARVLRQIIGLDVDDTDPLHVKLAQTIYDLGTGATYGQRITALRFDFAWELRAAGAEYGTTKADYEAGFSRRVVEIVETAAIDGRKVALGLAEHMASADLADLKLTYLVAEQRERAMRNFLQALDSALANHQTDRADARAADRQHEHGLTGGA